MTARSIRRFLLTAAAVALAATPAFAQSKAERYKKSIVKLFSEAVGPVTDSTCKVRVDGKDAVLGTVVEKGGYILTKGSEIREPVSVRFRDGSEYDAKYVGYSRDTDLALLKIDADPPPVTFAVFGTEAAVGNFVAAVGPESDAIGVGVLSVGARKLYFDEANIQNGNKGYLGIMFPRDDPMSLRIDAFGENKDAEDRSAAKKAGL